MKVKEIATGAVLESDNPFITEQWKKHSQDYKPLSDKEAAKILNELTGGVADGPDE